MGLARKDYAAIASAIKRTLDDDSLNARREVLQKVAARITAVLRKHNPRLNYENFMSECGFSTVTEANKDEPLG